MCSALLFLCTFACVPTPHGTDTADAPPDTRGDSLDSRHSVDTSDSGDSPAGDSDTDTSETAEDTDTAPQETGTPAVELSLGEDAAGKLLGFEQQGVGYDFIPVAAGDVNGDGFGDVFLGIPDYRLYGESLGGAYLVYGPVSGTISGPDDAIEFISDRAQVAGYSLAGAGDVDADGFDDLIIGATAFDNGEHGTGAAYLIKGPVTADQVLSAELGALLIGEYDEDQYYPLSGTGASVAGAGDVNGDGFDDVLVGASKYNDTGATYLVSGPISGEVELATAATLRVLGTSDSIVRPAGDLNADGLADFLIGRFSTTAGILVFYGPASGDVSWDQADATFEVDGSTYLGYAPSGAGDVDGDGYGDVLAESRAADLGANAGGVVWVVSGPVYGAVDPSTSAVAMLYGQEDYGGVGNATTALGDLDADGFDDIAIGEPQVLEDGDNPGNTYVLHGPLAGTFPVAYADYVVRGETGDNDMSGTYVAGPGDVDGDGIPDLLIGGPGDDTGGHNAGAAWVVAGALFP